MKSKNSTQTNSRDTQVTSRKPGFSRASEGGSKQPQKTGKSIENW
jgi:hypothetical protein